jgi:hypothetical protein
VKENLFAEEAVVQGVCAKKTAENLVVVDSQCAGLDQTKSKNLPWIHGRHPALI